MMKPLLTRVIVSPVEPPVSVRPALLVLVAYKYTPLFTVMVMSDAPALYPVIEVTFRDALAVLLEKV